MARMIFFINTKDRCLFEDFLKGNRRPQPIFVGELICSGFDEDKGIFIYHQEVIVDIDKIDLTSIKLKFDIKHRMFGKYGERL
jgi:hypothetical protein